MKATARFQPAAPRRAVPGRRLKYSLVYRKVGPEETERQPVGNMTSECGCMVHMTFPACMQLQNAMICAVGDLNQYSMVRNDSADRLVKEERNGTAQLDVRNHQHRPKKHVCPGENA